MTPWGGFMRMTREWRLLSLVAVVLLMTSRAGLRAGLEHVQRAGSRSGRRRTAWRDRDRHQPEHRCNAHDRQQRGRGLLPSGPRARRVPHRHGAARVPDVGQGKRDGHRQRDPVGRFQAVARRRGRGGHRDGRRPADRGHAVEGRVEHRGDRAPEPAAASRATSAGCWRCCPGRCRSSRSTGARRTSAACPMAGPRART